MIESFLIEHFALLMGGLITLFAGGMYFVTLRTSKKNK